MIAGQAITQDCIEYRIHDRCRSVGHAIWWNLKDSLHLAHLDQDQVSKYVEARVKKLVFKAVERLEQPILDDAIIEFTMQDAITEIWDDLDGIPLWLHKQILECAK